MARTKASSANAFAKSKKSLMAGYQNKAARQQAATGGKAPRKGLAAIANRSVNGPSFQTRGGKKKWAGGVRKPHRYKPGSELFFC